MQKLLQRSPPPTPLICTSVISSFLSFHSHSSFSKTPFVSVSLMPTGTAVHVGSSLAACVARKPTITSRLSSTDCCACRCSGQNRTTTTAFRAWVLPRLAWVHTAAGSDGPVSVAATKAAVEGLKNSDGGDNENGDSRAEKGSSSEEKVAARVNKRQKGSGDVVGNADLLTIPGVGPKNLRKLVEKGFRGMAELKQFYKDKFLGKSGDTMVEYLRSSVGIIHKNHAESITAFIKESVDEELKDVDIDVKAAAKKRITFCVEGNISVGKTTFLQRIIRDTIELRDLVEVVPEPIDKWQDIGPEHFNILDAFYAEPHRYAYTFQNYVFVTRVMQERESSGGVKPLRLMERSVFSDRMVFVRAVHEAKWMNEMEISIYDSWFDPVVSVLPGLVPDGFIYLRASPDTCHKRMRLRRREEEGGVSLDYLRGLHEKHESWLFPFQSGNHGVLSVSKLPEQLDKSLHPDIRDRVFNLEGDHMHSSIQKVPALVLDCEANIDFNKDIEAKECYAHQVAEFFKYVKSRKEVSSSPARDSSLLSNRQVLLPREGGFFLPTEKHFPKSAFGSLEFRRAMSFMSGQ